MTLLPKSGLAVILLYNRADLDSVGIVQSILERLVKPVRKGRQTAKGGQGQKSVKVSGGKPGATELARQRRFVGTYLSPYIGLVSVEMTHHQLFLRFNDEQIPLIYQKPDFYTGTYEGSEINITIGFVLPAEGPAEYVVLNPYGDDSVFHMLECQSVHPAELQVREPWQAYIGTYAHEDFGTYTVSFENGHMMLTLQEAREKTLCTPMGSGQFACKWGIFEFHLESNEIATSVTHKGHMMTLQRLVDTQDNQS